MKVTLTNILLVLLSVSVLTMIGTIFYHFLDTNYQTETAVTASAEQSVTFEGVYVRDETVLSYNGSGSICYNIPDGGRVGAEEAIANIYTNESAIEINQQITALQEELDVLSHISNPGVLQMAQPSTLADQVSQYYDQIAYCRDKGDLDGMNQAKEKFRIALSSYQLVIHQGTTNYSEQIASIESQIQDLQSQQQNPRDTIVAQESAYFVSYADGYEDKFSIQNLSNITADDLASVTDDDTIKSDTIIGKTISSYGWYMMGIIDNTELSLQVGDTVTLYLSSSSVSTQVTVSELRPGDVPNQTLLVLYCDRMSSDFVQHRIERVRLVKGAYEGIKVPRSAIRFRDVEESTTNVLTGEVTTTMTNYRGVYVMDGEEVVFRKLDVIYEGDDYVLSDMNAGSGYLILYDSIIVEGIDANGGAG
ncbi:MAG: HlyD family efflux transporter periplasmic adaptor subunit [Ruminococcus sp.]